MDINGVVGIITAVWAFIGVILPILIQFLMWRSPHKGIIQICLILTAVCCYLFWLSAYLCQLNPLIGPQLSTGLIRMMQYEWDGMQHGICESCHKTVSVPLGMENCATCRKVLSENNGFLFGGLTLNTREKKELTKETVH